MAHSTRKNTYAEPLWNLSLLPAPSAAPRNRSDLPQGPGPQGGGSALRSSALLSVSASTSEDVACTAQAA